MAAAAKRTITFRDQTSGKISDFTSDEGYECALTQALISYLCGAIVNYKDEGVEISPLIVITDNIATFLSAFPGSVTYQIGELPLKADSGKRILKDCAPLFGPNWTIYIERADDKTLRYGVFSYYKLPTAIPIEEGIELNPSSFAILLRKISESTIELRGSKSNRLTLIFSTLRERPEVEANPIGDFAKTCTSDLANSETAERFKVYLTRLLSSTLSSSHGTIIVSRKYTQKSSIKQLKDSVSIFPVIDFYRSYAESRIDDAGSVLALQRNEELLTGFMRCDGVIVFNSIGQVTAYRAFYRGTANIPDELVGGARRRAFEGIKELVGQKLRGALFRSQDGLTLFKGVE